MSYTIQPSTAREQGRCKTWSCCGLDEPLANYTSDHDELPAYFRMVWDGEEPEPFDEDWESEDCNHFVWRSTVSQADADRMAALANMLARFCPPGGLGYCNDPQTCSLNCAELAGGGVYTHTIPACVVGSKISKADANAIAMSICEAALGEQAICIDSETANVNLPGGLPNGCYYKFYTGSLKIGGTANIVGVSIISGSLPTGVTMNWVGRDINFQGIPLEWGSFVLTIQVNAQVSSTGDIGFATRTVGFCILRIVTPDLADDTSPTPPHTRAYLRNSNLNEEYSVKFIAEACSPTYAWRLLSGTIPPGMVFDSAGYLYGTPTVTGDYHFEVEVIDDEVGSHVVVPTPAFPPRAGIVAAFDVIPSPGYFPNTFNFINRSVGTGHLTYRWDFGDGTTSTLQNPTHTYNEDGITPRTVTLVVFDGYISEAFARRLGSPYPYIFVEDFDIEEWKIALPAGQSVYYLNTPVVSEAFHALNPSITGSLPEEHVGALPSELIFRTRVYDRYWHLYYLATPDPLGTLPWWTTLIFFGEGVNKVATDIGYWVWNTVDPPTWNWTQKSYFTHIAFSLKKGPPSYPAGWMFQAWVDIGDTNGGFSGTGPQYNPVGGTYAYPDYRQWRLVYTALKPFVPGAALELPTGTYIWSNDVAMYYPGADPTTMRTDYSMPASINLTYAS